MFDIQTIFNYYTSPFLAATFAWYAVLGYLAHACVLMLLTKLSFRTIFQPLLRFHAIALVISYICTPVVVVLFCKLIEMSLGSVPAQRVSLLMFMYFAWLMYWVSAIFLCSFFKESSCNRFKQSLFIADSCLVILGYFVLMLVQQNFGIVWF